MKRKNIGRKREGKMKMCLRVYVMTSLL